MTRCCKNCGRELPDDWINEWCSVCMDEFGTFILNSPFNPGM